LALQLPLTVICEPVVPPSPWLAAGGGGLGRGRDRSPGAAPAGCRGRPLRVPAGGLGIGGVLIAASRRLSASPRGSAYAFPPAAFVRGYTAAMYCGWMAFDAEYLADAEPQTQGGEQCVACAGTFASALRRCRCTNGVQTGAVLRKWRTQRTSHAFSSPARQSSQRTSGAGRYAHRWNCGEKSPRAERASNLQVQHAYA